MILSEHGEGYCSTCHFVVGLDASGGLEPHGRGASLGWEKPCKGSNDTPLQRTPVTCQEVAFRVTAPTARCPRCEREVGTAQHEDRRVYQWHYASKLNRGPRCLGSVMDVAGP